MREAGFVSIEMARAIRRVVKQELQASKTLPTPQTLRRPRRGRSGSTVRRGKTTSSVTAIDDTSAVAAGSTSVQLYKPDPANAGEWIVDGSPVSVANWSTASTTTTDLWCLVARDVHGVWVLLTLDCEEEEV